VLAQIAPVYPAGLRMKRQRAEIRLVIESSDASPHKPDVALLKGITWAALNKIIPHFHLEHGVDAREAVDHDGDERAVPQSHKRRLLRFRLASPAARVSRDRDTVEQLAGLLGRQHGCLAFSHYVFWDHARRGPDSRPMMWPITIQSKSMRSAARCCLTVGGVNSS
jgi:hypothetical protein